jgi:recombination protein RecA
MAKGVDRKKLIATLKELEKEYGEGSVYSLDSNKAILDIPRWSTGLEDLDKIIGGGMPYGRIIEISGPESAGKTSLAYHLMAQHEVAVDIPVEGTFDNERAKVFGNRKGQLFVRRAEYGEQCLESVMAFADAGVPCVVIDSVPHMIPRKQFEEPDMEKENQLGRIAAMLSANLPKVAFRCEKTMTTLILINQVRDVIGGMLFGPKTHTPGGWALKHACSLRLQVNRVSWIKVPNKNPKNSANEEAVGLVMKVKVLKSKVCNPLGECVLTMFFDRGFVPNDEMKAIRKEIMKQRNEEYKNACKNKIEVDGDE